jgi:hypothetical protein
MSVTKQGMAAEVEMDAIADLRGASAAKGAGLLDHDDRSAGLRYKGCGRQPCETAANHDQVWLVRRSSVGNCHGTLLGMDRVFLQNEDGRHVEIVTCQSGYFASVRKLPLDRLCANWSDVRGTIRLVNSDEMVPA